MDKYLIRTPRSMPTVISQVPHKKDLKQTTIESLKVNLMPVYKGVVVVEEILRFKALLKVHNQSPEMLLSILNKLWKKIPSRDVLKSTRIGHVVKSLTDHSDSSVAKLSTKLVKNWKKHFTEKLDRPMIEVRSDRSTERVRSTGRKYLAAALQITVSESLCEAIEREVFHQHHRLVRKSYRENLFRLISALKHDADLRSKLIRQTISIAECVKKYRPRNSISCTDGSSTASSTAI